MLWFEQIQCTISALYTSVILNWWREYYRLIFFSRRCVLVMILSYFILTQIAVRHWCCPVKPIDETCGMNRFHQAFWCSGCRRRSPSLIISRRIASWWWIEHEYWNACVAGSCGCESIPWSVSTTLSFGMSAQQPEPCFPFLLSWRCCVLVMNDTIRPFFDMIGLTDGLSFILKFSII